jgi:hypothetical protein
MNNNSLPIPATSAFSNNVARMDTPVCNDSMPYDFDVKFFSQHKKRKQYLRVIWPGEFGSSKSFSKENPKILVWIYQIAPGTHYVSIVWIGEFWYDHKVSTDLQVTQFLAEMSRLGGMSKFYRDDYLAALNEQMASERAQRAEARRLEAVHE